MKKNLLLSLITIVMMAVQGNAETRQVVLLLHEGTGRTFEFDQLQEAVNAAEAGDTICLNEGNYSFPDNLLVIDKPISIIGTGQSTHLLGSIDISIPDSVTLKSHLLEALWVYNNVEVKQPVNSLKFRKVKFGGNLGWSATTRDVEIDRCYVHAFFNRPELMSANIINSIIRNQQMYIATPLSSITFINCMIGYMNWEVGRYSGNNYSKYVNCFIDEIPWANEIVQLLHNTECYNTLFKETVCMQYFGILDNCYYIFNGSTSSSYFDPSKPNGCTLTEEQLLEAGYLGDDGKVVGVEGGMTPYTLVPNGISVKKSKLEIDGEKRKLKVTLQLQAQ